MTHQDYTKADNWNGKVIGAAIEVHRDKGPGLIESIYGKCLMRELERQRIPARNARSLYRSNTRDTYSRNR